MTALLPRLLPPVVTVCAAVVLLGGCGTDAACEPAPAGAADTRTAVMRGDGDDQHLTAEVTEWHTAPHPQVPGEGDHVFLTVDVTPVPGFHVVDDGVALQVCAIDAERVVLICGEVFAEVAADGSATTAEGDLRPADPAATARVVVLANRLDGGVHGCGDRKDFDGYTPPRILSPGTRV
ncbi:hypothetical protein [Phytomonospora endophytica]|uniref:Lipoprotein n=1 Tax=Phytomonospora endophytica TaxID=714109 RepID=A0A841FFI9_9ACTN|nr:hypothetical protein [Phytomonospora endophytica]MBB6034614.1 hypothetical protein [Phytomonospora endophytica]GIG71326.1 hypothetical protein Pen01_76210 [Phytomonospora endophytica]